MALHGTGCTGKGGRCGKSEDVQSLQEIILYGLKGMAAYAHHARRLGKADDSVNAFIEDALFATLTNVNFDLNDLLGMAMELGQKNLRVMQLLDEAHVQTFGQPAPVTVQQGTRAEPGILITGHDLLDLQNLLRQLEGTPIKVYTHGEMLPAHMYPKLHQHPNMAGHYGTAWQNQHTEFDAFPGPILATTNCIQLPRPSYADRMFTTRVTAAPGTTCIKNNDFSAVIARAKSCPTLPENITGQSTIGFHHSVILNAAPAIVEAVKEGKVSGFHLIGGCDGPESSRSYFSDYAKSVPQDAFILTLGCGKFRINKHDYGTLLGLPRLLDLGQCNDSYSAIQVAVALAKAFNCSVNELPLTIVLSWLEQKAVAVLLTLLSLNVQGIIIGPTPPAFVSPNVFKILQDKFNLRLIPSAS